MRNHRFYARPQAVSAALLLAVALFALVMPLFAPDPRSQDLDHVLSVPGAIRPLGTDHLGRDMLARVSSAARLSFGLAAVSVLTAAIPGSLLGIFAAWRGAVGSRQCC